MYKLDNQYSNISALKTSRPLNDAGFVVVVFKAVTSTIHWVRKSSTRQRRWQSHKATTKRTEQTTHMCIRLAQSEYWEVEALECWSTGSYQHKAVDKMIALFQTDTWHVYTWSVPVGSNPGSAGLFYSFTLRKLMCLESVINWQDDIIKQRQNTDSNFINLQT